MHEESTPPPATDDTGVTPESNGRESLRGSLVIVLSMAVFFVACWFGMLAIMLERR